jgi:hypothetical protein
MSEVGHGAMPPEYFIGDLVQEKSVKDSKVWIIIEVEPAGSFSKISKNSRAWIYNDDLILVSRAKKGSETNE